MSRRLLVFTGCPSPASLKWDEDKLENKLLPAFETVAKQQPSTNATQDSPTWRYLPLQAVHLPKGMTQTSRPGVSFEYASQELAGQAAFGSLIEPSSFASSAPERTRILDTDSSVPQSHINSQYYEHSFGVHDELQSSQIIGSASAEGLSSSAATETEVFESFDSSEPDIHPQKQAVHARLHSASVSDLKEIPNAAYLRSIVPQTMTVNLVVGVISISQPRRIVPRNGGPPVELVEMLVGDETSAGFTVNIWIPPAQGEGSNGSRNRDNYKLRNEIGQLRPRDVILARRVALNSFRNQAYGQSLRRGLTSLDLLFRTTIDAEDSRGVFTAKELDSICESDQIAKVRRVKEWVVCFLGGSTLKVKNSPFHSRAGLSSLPLDTP